MLDDLWEQDPWIQKLQAEARARGEIRGTQKAVVNFVEARFPALGELAQRQVALVKNLDDLHQLIKLIATTPDETTAYQILSRLAA